MHPPAAPSPTLTLEIGSTTATSDLLAITGAATVGAGGAVLNIAPIATPSSSANTYTLITAASGLNTNLTLGGVTNYNISGTLFHLTLGTSTATSEIASFVAGGASTASAFWTGSQSTSSWATQNGTTFNTNFSTDAAGANNTLALPGSNTNVTFTANSASNLSTTLDGSYTINSLNFSGTGTSNTAGTTIASGSGGTLTINAAALNGNAAGNGITVAAGSGPNTISANVTLGGSQTWTNNSANTLLVSGNVSNGANTLTLAGTGNTTISGAIGSGVGGLVTNSTGTVTLSGTSTYGGGTRANGGTLTISGSVVNTGSFVSVNNVGATNATLKVVSGATLGMSDFNIGEAVNSRAAVFQSGGDITVNANTNGAFRLGNNNGAYGYYNMSGGTLTLAGTAGEFNVGGNNTSTLGVMDVSAGTISTKTWILIGRSTTSSGLLNVTGGSVTSTSNDIALNWGTGVSILNVGGGAGAAAVTGVSSAGNGWVLRVLAARLEQVLPTC